MTLFCLFILGLFQNAKAADMSIVDVRRNITLAENDPVYKDFYINTDSSSGLKKNLVVTAVRKINIRDASGTNSFGEILIPVGQLKIIAIFDKIAVAREFELLSRDELPMLEQVGIMTGDRIDLHGAFIDNSKPKKHKITESQESQPATQTAATTPPQPPLTPAPTIASTEKVLQKPTETKSLNMAQNTPASPPAEVKGTPPGETTSKAPPPARETLEKVADSGNNSGHE